MAVHPPSAFNEKVGGLALLLCGALAAKFCLVDTLAKAERGVAIVYLAVKGVVLIPGTFLLGTCLLVLPPNSMWR